MSRQVTLHSNLSRKQTSAASSTCFLPDARPGVVVSAGCSMHPKSSGAYEPVANMKYQPGKCKSGFIHTHWLRFTRRKLQKSYCKRLATFRYSGSSRATATFTGSGLAKRFLRKRFVWADLFSENKNHEKIIKPVLEEADKIGTPVTVSKKYDTFLSCHPKMYRASQYFWARWSQEGIHQWNRSILQFS